MRIISGTIKSAPLPWLPVMSNIEPAKFRRQMALKRMFERCDLHQDFLLYKFRQSLPGSRLKRKPPWLNENQTFNLMELKQIWTQNYVVNVDSLIDPSYQENYQDLMPEKDMDDLNRIRCD